MALSAFVAAARSLSFQHAAEALNVTPGAVSRQIRALEEQLGRTLFERGHRQVALTPDGRAYLDAVRGPLEALEAATRRMRRRPQRDSVAVVAYPTFAIRWFIPRWGRFYNRHPEIDLQLTTSLDPAEFRREAFDIAIRVAGPGEVGEGHVAEELLPVTLFPVAAPEVAAAVAEPPDLRKVTLLHGAPRPEDWPRWLAGAGIGSVDASGGLRFESLNLAIQAAIEGLGAVIAIGALVEEDIRAGRLVRLPGPPRRARRSMRLVSPAARAEEPRVRAVRDWLLEEARGARRP
ncbi:LysR substrate-binding domain-containing protein [Minwuia thermotolerans]|nr:LysR substrate-binding domain-containing protein [Minwuia thermotolerans]